jgi:ATP-binding cassette, subfamily B, bacterial MsbA
MAEAPEDDARSQGKDPETRAVSSISVARRLLREALPSRWTLYVLSLFLMVGVAASTGALAYSTKLIVNDVFVAADASAAYRVAGLVVLVALLKSVFQYFNAVIQTLFNRSISADYQRRVFREFLLKDVRHFEREHASGQMARVRLFGQASGTTVVNLASKLPSEVLTLLALFGVMMFQDPLMTVASCILIPVIFLLVSNLSRRVRRIANAEMQLASGVFAIGTEAFSGIKTVKSYGLEDKSIGRFNAGVAALEARLMRIARTTAATVPIMEFLGGLVIGLFVVYAAWQTINHGRTPGEFTAFITAFLMAYQPAERVSHILVDLQKSLMHVNSMFSQLDEPPKRPVAGTRTLEGTEPSITFNDVTFLYGGTKKALHGVSFRIEPGERVAVVGKSGAGKSTLVDLVLRFYDPVEGRVLIGDVPLPEVSEASLRESIALISQDVFLFDGSILENILDGNPAATPQDALAAARLAALDDLLVDDPMLGKIVGPNGGTLSGGQRQRVGIARALVKRAMIYVFDEATSALDVENERQIMTNLRQLRGATVLFVTHRFSTITYVDRVMMLQEGRLLAIDTPRNIQASSADFRTLFDITE